MTETAQIERNRRRVLQGTVTSASCSKTITVLVERTFAHPKYGKFVRKHKKYHAHDERNEAQVGDVVEIMATRPMSKLKRWRLTRIVESPALRTTPVSQTDAAMPMEANTSTTSVTGGDSEAAGGDA
jgi:small subunit ribosomal protein S17